MAITRDGKTEYEGLVIRVDEHMWMDGMLEVNAVVWDMDIHATKHIQVGYYGSDGRNLCGAIDVDIDLSREAKRDILRTIKHNEAPKAFERSVIAAKTAISKGTKAEVVRGRKVKKGTKLEVFWVGDRLTYQAQRYGYSEYETIAGCYDEDGNKVWIRTDYLKNIDPIKSPRAAERKKFIKAYVIENAKAYGIRV